MPLAKELAQRARVYWIRAGALSTMFGRESRLVEGVSVRLTWTSISLGGLTGLSGVLAASWAAHQNALAVAAGVVGVLTGLTNTIRETMYPGKKHIELWSDRNGTARLQDQLAKTVQACGAGNAPLKKIENSLDQLEQKLQQFGGKISAKKVTTSDEATAATAFVSSFAHSSFVALVNESSPPAREEEEVPAGAGLVAPSRGASA